MGAPRKATNLLLLNGAFDKNPQRARENEPESKAPFPKKPPALYRLTKHEQSCWSHIVDIVPVGVLKESDLPTVLQAIKLLSKLIKNTIMATEMARLSIELGKLGLSPSDRAKLTVEKGKANKFDD